MRMAKILVTGAGGQLGSELRDIAPYFPQHEFFFAGRKELDIADEKSIKNVFSVFAPDYCINCAAYTAVDKAETEKEQAFAVNATAVKNTAKASRQQATKLIHISTDYVFDGTATEPYKEEDTTNPLSVYGQSKLQGEIEVQKEAPSSVIIRTSWVYSSYGNNFVKTMLRLMQSRPEINVVDDQYGSPTYAADLAKALLDIIDKTNWQPGIYHYSNEGVTTWYGFAEAIKKMSGSACAVHPITTDQYPTAAKRPRYSVLNKEKIKTVFHVQLPYWEESLRTCLHKLETALR